jgi:hypothetical protein
MRELGPAPEATQVLLVIIAEGTALHSAEICQAFDAYLVGIKVILLKKHRTQL